MLLPKTSDQRFSLEKTAPGINWYLFSEDEQSVNFINLFKNILVRTIKMLLNSLSAKLK